MSNEDKGSKSGQQKPEDKLRFSKQQYDMLKRCSDKKDITEWNEWRQDHWEEEIWLQGVDLEGAYLENAMLRSTHLEMANLEDAHLENANLREAHLENANLLGAHLEKANLNKAILVDSNLQRANLSCAYAEETKFDCAFLSGACFNNAHLKGASFWRAKSQDAKFIKADLQNTKFHDAHLERAKFHKAIMYNSYLQDSHLLGTIFYFSNLHSANFQTALVNGATSFWGSKVNQKTNFLGVGLDITRIEPATKQLLKYNIRRMNWEQWYKEHLLLQWPVKLFWSFSNYGISTWRIIGWFFVLSLAFAAIYANCACWWPPGIVNNLEVEPHLPLWHYGLLVILRPVYFSIVTMTTLGFGDMHANEASILGHALLTLQVILGYVLLGAMVTRFAVLFTAGGPAGKFAQIKTKRKSKD